MFLEMLPIIPSQRLSPVAALPPEVAEVAHVPPEQSRAIMKEVVNYGIPSMGGFMVASFNEMVSLFWLAKVGTEPVAAVTVLMTIYWTMMTFNIIAGVGSNAIIARRFGEGVMQESEIAIRAAFMMKLVLGTLIGLAAWVLMPVILPLMDTEPAVEAMALQYGHWMFPAAGVVGCSYSVYSAFRCIGMPRMAWWMQLLGAGTNMILDPLLIFGIGPFPELGIVGAAIGAVTSYLLVMGIGMYVLSTPRSPIPVRWFQKPWPSMEEFKQIWSIGWPVGLNILSFSVAMTFSVRLVTHYGTDVVAIFGAAQRVMHFGIMSMVGFTLGTSALVAQFLGAKELVKSWIAGVHSIRVAGYVMLTYGAILFLFAEQIVRAFFGIETSVELGATLLRIMAISLPFAGIHIGAETVFEGAGHNQPMMLLSLAHAWLLMVPFMYVFGITLVWGPVGMIWGATIAHSLGGLIAVWLFYKGSWLRVTV